tara:strand:+ start:502 stop:885 length:384 start_codon:yes stop_codon:yes gene_type:complete
MKYINIFLIIIIVALLFVISSKKNTINNETIAKEHETRKKLDKHLKKESTDNLHNKRNVIRKDTMNASPIGTENLAFIYADTSTLYHAWTTKDLSSTPSFYKSDFKTDLLGMKNFYDKNNVYYSNAI